ncbi:hypothetical protein Pmani_034561 [Petrolisthes manimaculis]|uniref:Uncharacterized protein n=1 Tax=Petrolisthes manimaculis TaxID=1843537 RepID=A0AAE1TP99_9EUCA|nr:hypothetical protein Pmani_034561 [Petrolisthes manimaculis]
MIAEGVERGDEGEGMKRKGGKVEMERWKTRPRIDGRTFKSTGDSDELPEGEKEGGKDKTREGEVEGRKGEVEGRKGEVEGRKGEVEGRKGEVEGKEETVEGREGGRGGEYEGETE